MERGIQIKGVEDPDPRAFDTDAVLVSQEEIEEQFAQVAELNKTMEDMKSEHVFALHRKTAELLDDLKQVWLCICMYLRLGRLFEGRRQTAPQAVCTGR